MNNILETVTLIYKNKMNRLYEEHQQKLNDIFIVYGDNEKEYIRQYIKEVDRYIKECNDLRSEFIIDSINASV